MTQAGPAPHLSAAQLRDHPLRIDPTNRVPKRSQLQGSEVSDAEGVFWPTRDGAGLTIADPPNPNENPAAVLGPTADIVVAVLLGHAFFQHSRDEFADVL